MTSSLKDSWKIYLDYNATTPLESEVLDEITRALRDAWGNPSSSHNAGVKAKDVITGARKQVADMVGAKTSDIVFTSGGTETNNWIFHIAIRHFQKTFSDDTKMALPHIIISNMEHDSVKLVLEQLVKDGVAEVSFIPASVLTGEIDVEDVLLAIRPTTVLISVMLANNETGIIQPIPLLCRAVRQLKRHAGETKRILLHTDAAQAIGKVKVSVKELGVDYLTIVGHKFYGPRIGALFYSHSRTRAPIYPMILGGGQELSLRSGTENTGMIAGLGKAAELVCKNLTKYENHLREIRDYLEDLLKAEFEDKVVFNGKFSDSCRLPNTSNLSFVGQRLKGHLVLSKTKNLQASIGAACHKENRPSPILLAIGVPPDIAENAIRLSVGRETTKEEIEIVVKDLKCAVKSLEENLVENANVVDKSSLEKSSNKTSQTKSSNPK